MCYTIGIGVFVDDSMRLTQWLTWLDEMRLTYTFDDTEPEQNKAPTRDKRSDDFKIRMKRHEFTPLEFSVESNESRILIT